MEEDTMTNVRVHNQTELDAAIAAYREGDRIICCGPERYNVSDSATVEAWDSATVRASGSATVRASRYVAVHKMDTTVTVSGGVVIEPPSIDSAQAWLDYHGVEARDGVVILHKAVTDNWHASRALPDGTLPSYAPGEQPSAPDFDPSMRDCGGGLHACARPTAALCYHEGPKLVAIPVRVTDLGCPDPHGDTGKIRFRCAAEPIYEVDIDGRAI